MIKANKTESPSNSKTYYLAYLHFINGQLPKAEALYRKALQKSPKNIPILIDLAKTLFQQGKYAESLEYFRKLHSLSGQKNLIAPYIDRLELALSTDLSDLKQEEANNKEIPQIRHPYYKEVVLESRSADLLLSNAYKAFLKEDLKRADTLYSIADTELKSEVLAEDLETWGLVKLKLNQRTAAKTIYKSSLKRFPEAFQAHINLADVLLAENKIASAEKLYSQALSTKTPKIAAQALRGLGRIMVMKGELKEGLKTMLKSLEKDSGAALTHEDLGRIYGDLGDYKTALEHLDTAQNLGLKVDPYMIRVLKGLQKKQ